jgi:hypothetical protein
MNEENPPIPLFTNMNMEEPTFPTGEVTLETNSLKENLWEQDILTITIVLGLRFYDYVRKEWKEFRPQS